jgi:hypothetical protein
LIKYFILRRRETFRNGERFKDKTVLKYKVISLDF